MKKSLPIILILLLIAAGAAFWYFFLRGEGLGNIPGNDITTPGGFSPIDRPGGAGSIGPGGIESPDFSTTTEPRPVRIPTLRLLSSTPIGGYGASTTASTTIVRWVDRGRGNVYEARGDTLEIATLSNTVVPKIVDSIWGREISSFVAAIFDTDNMLDHVYAELRARPIPTPATSTATSTSTTSTSDQTGLGVGADGRTVTPFELKGTSLPDNIIGYAASPKKDRLLMLVADNEGSTAYLSTFDGKSVTQLFRTPLTQINVAWPEENTIVVTTRGTATEGGFLYFVDPKTGIWRKILGPVAGLSAVVSTDAKRIIVSTTGNQKNVLTSIYTVSEGKGIDALVRTIADKCAWGNFYKELVYCAVPSPLPEAVYPDDWYKGTISTVDKIWQINSVTGELKIVSSITDTSDRLIDAFNLSLDDKDNFLFFMNKNDLSFWSLDLVSAE